MPTLNVCVQIYMIKKNTQNYEKYKYFSSFQKLCQCIKCIYVYKYLKFGAPFLSRNFLLQ